MVQQATVIAVFAYDAAAMRDKRLPRKALPAPKRGGNRLNEGGDDRQRDPRKESIDIIPPWPENGRS